jgi:hypothetical protein
LISYIWNAIIITFEQLIILLGPALLLAFIMNYFALLVRIMQQRLIKNSFLDWFCAPGIIVHELGHAFFCVVFGHRIMRMNLFRPGSHDGTLGYVKHAFDPGSLYQRIGNFFIGTGPIWFGTIVIYLMSRYMLNASAFNSINDIELTTDTLSSWSGVVFVAHNIINMVLSVIQSMFNFQLFSRWEFYIFIYLVFVIGNNITLSLPDIRNSADGLIVLIVILLIFNLCTSFMGDFSIEFVKGLSKTYTLFISFMLFALILNILISLTLFTLSFGGIFVTQKLKSTLEERKYL